MLLHAIHHVIFSGVYGLGVLSSYLAFEGLSCYLSSTSYLPESSRCCGFLSLSSFILHVSERAGVYAVSFSYGCLKYACALAKNMYLYPVVIITEACIVFCICTLYPVVLLVLFVLRKI